MLLNLNSVNRRSIAASLEIDGRADIAASIVYSNVVELVYVRGKAFSAQAKGYEALLLAIVGAITLLGVEAVVKALRDGLNELGVVA
ncbi:hypothetical protein QN354_09510 [Cryobacterium sp. 5I3]|uniref:hypothetical protein n=1 Tax=Cryobacterium sp. 5I3 TaxID=3048592 RepID=UPI002B232725|nr:hypothetical protein [Cryobacterium sp. 5I3]MEB0201992.1 hypothetical protein [Cryobacterium sp. 5I3]